MGAFFKGVLVVISLFSFSFAEITFDVDYKTEGPRKSESAIRDMVSYSLGLDNESVPYFRAHIKVYGGVNSSQNYLVVTLFRSDSYLAEIYRLDYRDNQVTEITPDYFEENSDERLCGTCPDPEAEYLISYIEDALFPGAIQHGWGTWSMANSAGVNCALLIGHNETKQAVLNYLDCPKLRGWGRIGHGTRESIQFNNYKDRLTVSDLASLSGDIEGKTFIFNSCLCHNDPFEPAMINAGAYFFAAGDISLKGGKEGVFSAFFNKAIQSDMELTKAMDQAVSENNYLDAWGYSGSGQAPYYLQFGMTEAVNTTPMAMDIFSILVTTNQVLFSHDADAPVSLISIFNPIGKLVYQNRMSQGTSVWDMTTENGHKATNGNYIAVIGNQTGTSSINKAFTIVK